MYSGLRPSRSLAERSDVVTSSTRDCWDSRVAPSMESVIAIQAVQVLLRTTPSLQPSS
jgi:hypothetical protein